MNADLVVPVTGPPGTRILLARTGGAVLRAAVAVVLAGLAVVFVVDRPAQAGPVAALARTVDRVVPAQLARYRIPGAAVVIVAGGRQVYAKGFGVADRGRRTPVDPSRTRFYIGSVGKVFTAAAVLRLVRAGKLDLDADVNRYLDTFQIADTYPGRPVRVRDLLTHTSGFDDTVLGVATPPGHPVPALGRWLAAHQPARVRPPGTLPSYDNYGVALAGYLVERVSGEPFAEYVRQHVLAPLDIRHTTVTGGGDAGMATGYRSDGSVATGGQLGPLVPAGAGMTAVPTDLGRFALAQLHSGNPVLRRHFGTDPRMPGMGWIFEEHPRDGQRVLSKDGDVPGFHDNLALLPADHLGVYVVYNGDGKNAEATFAGHDLVNRIVDTLHHPAAPAPASTAGHHLDRYAGSYRITRYDHHDLTAVAQLTSAVTVTADTRGLTTTGLSDDPDTSQQHWIPVGDGLFRERGGQATIAFHRNGVLLSSANPTVAYQRLSWYQSPGLHLALLGGATLVLLYVLLVWPVAGIVQRRHGWLPTAARWSGWLTAVSAGTFLVLLTLVLSDAARLNEHIMLNDSPALTATPVVMRVTAGLAGAMVVFAVLAWVRRWWRLPGRIGYTVGTLAAGTFVGVGAAYNLLL